MFRTFILSKTTVKIIMIFFGLDFGDDFYYVFSLEK